MKYALHITAEAEEDISGSFHWYEEQLKGLGERFPDALDDRFNELRLHPAHYSFINEDSRLVYRDVMLRRFPYRVVFRMYGSIVVIVAVYHASLDPDKLRLRIHYNI